jgi:hypothetical protein
MVTTAKSIGVKIFTRLPVSVSDMRMGKSAVMAIGLPLHSELERQGHRGDLHSVLNQSSFPHVTYRTVHLLKAFPIDPYGTGVCRGINRLPIVVKHEALHTVCRLRDSDWRCEQIAPQHCPEISSKSL